MPTLATVQPPQCGEIWQTQVGRGSVCGRPKHLRGFEMRTEGRFFQTQQASGPLGWKMLPSQPFFFHIFQLSIARRNILGHAHLLAVLNVVKVCS